MEHLEAIQEKGWFADDNVSENHDFNNTMEQILYFLHYKPEKQIRQVSEPWASLYLNYGAILFELGRIDEARTVLEKARRFNPVSPEIAFEYIETFKVKGDLETFAEKTRDTFRFAYRSTDVARCFRNLGYYFVEKELWQPAFACYRLSLSYDRDNANAMSELYYISQHAGDIKISSREEIRQLADQYDFPVKADDQILAVAASLGNKELEKRNIPAAKFFLNIFYDLTRDEEVKKLIDRLEHH